MPGGALENIFAVLALRAMRHFARRRGQMVSPWPDRPGATGEAMQDEYSDRPAILGERLSAWLHRVSWFHSAVGLAAV